ncbi:DUF6957 family protein [Pseudomonas sp. NPDC088368]|uniref:DUF6957 family protein n=1 Tax=Pseudomonas sp. NPDC088368 TaxID=3364453 RepID=UPI00381C0B63
MPKSVGLLDLSGELQDGASSKDISTLEALGANTTKAVCGLYSWIVLDVPDADLNQASASTITESGMGGAGSDKSDADPARLPRLLCGHYVEHHSRGRFRKGDSILAGYATQYDGRGIFQTSDTIYILLGKGFRRSATTKTASFLPEGWINASELVMDPPGRPSGLKAFRALNESNENVYCDLQMSVEQAGELATLVRGLRQAGQHPNLKEVFQAIENELETSIGNAR